MESITLEEFKNQTGKALIILFVFSIFSIYRIVKGEFHNDHIAIAIISILGIIGVRQLLIIGEQKIITGNRKLKSFESILLENILIFGLGILSIYVFAVKGAYGIYLLFKDFSFKELLYRLVIVIASYQLVVAVSKIQSVFKSVQSNK